jgi:hypothetical protein
VPHIQHSFIVLKVGPLYLQSSTVLYKVIPPYREDQPTIQLRDPTSQPCKVVLKEGKPAMEKKWQYPHRRWNPLRRSWVMVSPHRTQRPWQGEVSKTAAPAGLTYDPECYLCPGNKRAGGEVNPPTTVSFHL